jgi:hypothetical protein
MSTAAPKFPVTFQGISRFFTVSQNFLLFPRFLAEPLTMFCRTAKYPLKVTLVFTAFMLYWRGSLSEGPLSIVCTIFLVSTRNVKNGFLGPGENPPAEQEWTA